ncbi:hypothetical protein CEUSTIGMA_g7660.t1 [Chlamydomonas eustigma]|uniref:Amine oxidase domain-containing protein n=1 Tax=Chlamydomonas eustigma TaxID=1157962 RepID=A0A250XBH2_9CHLO|nr:hypothetical protein CEUSTIGMA_g7660.t1 [Chlamydomonas eustigma]|eukprot:GAX80222.1 hypothetical protein CEUSTIGMA_g7660.t1 [Chlamydomonas eustigma]
MLLNEIYRIGRVTCPPSKNIPCTPSRTDVARRTPSTRHALRHGNKYPSEDYVIGIETDADTDVEYDAIIIGSGMGGLTAASQMVARGARVLVLEKYVLPGGSAGHYKREGYTFDVGSSMMFGLGSEGNTNLITKCLEAVGKTLVSIPDPTQVHYHLPKSNRFPQGLDVQVWRKYEDFIQEMITRFPHEESGIKGFYGECWTVFNSLNSIELKSLEEPRYLMQQFVNQPLSCLKLASYLPVNTGDVARRYIHDPELLRFIDMECFTYSTVQADLTPMVTSGMVMCDRHYGGVRYPVGGIGRIAETVAEGITELGGHIMYKANVKEILVQHQEARTVGVSSQSSSQSNGSSKASLSSSAASKAMGVRLADGREFRSKTVISNASRWDTFEHMIPDDRLPEGEKLFRERYKKAPSFFSMHLGVKADVLPPGTDCHHIILEDWDQLEKARGTLFISMPSLLDPSLAPEGHHIVHAFTPDWIDAWQGLSPEEYNMRKEEVADVLCRRMEAVFPGISEAITFRELGTPRTHRRYLSRPSGTYGPIPTRAPLGVVTMPLNSTDISGLYCVGDSTFPGQGVNAVVFSGFGCAHRALCDLGMEPSWPALIDQGYRAALKWVREEASKLGASTESANKARKGSLNIPEQQEGNLVGPLASSQNFLSNIVPLDVAVRKLLSKN